MSNKKKTPTTVEELTKILKWRLSKAPTLEDVQSMLKDDIIDKEEARQMLFSTAEQTSEREEALKEQIKFLEKVIEKLTEPKLSVTTTWPPSYTVTPNYPVKYWVTSGNSIGNGTGIYSLGANTVSLNQNLLASSGHTANRIQ